MTASSHEPCGGLKLALGGNESRVEPLVGVSVFAFFPRPLPLPDVGAVGVSSAAGPCDTLRFLLAAGVPFSLAVGLPPTLSK